MKCIANCVSNKRDGSHFILISLLRKHIGPGKECPSVNPNTAFIVLANLGVHLRRLVGDLSIFYGYFNWHCSQEIRDIIPVPLRRVKTTRSSIHSHPFQVSLPNPQILSHKSSFIPRTCNIWNILPSSCFPESYKLPSFKSKINKLDLISLSPLSLLLSS